MIEHHPKCLRFKVDEDWVPCDCARLNTLVNDSRELLGLKSLPQYEDKTLGDVLHDPD